jgi:iron complex transport system substrate-binding protein
MTPTTLERSRTRRRPAAPALGDLGRRDLLGAAGVLLAGGLAAGCGADADGGASAAKQTRRIRHDMGTTDIPVNPRRVVIVDSFTTLHTALLLDAPVVGAMTFGQGQSPFASFLGKDETKGIKSIGYPEIKLEIVVALQPDLIVGSTGFMGETGVKYSEFAEIAPTVAVDYIPPVQWKADERQLGRVFDGVRRMEKALADYEARIAAFKRQMGSRLDDIEVGFIRFMPDEIRIHTPHHFAGSVLAEAGLRRPASHDTDDPKKLYLSLSEERLPEIDADLLFYAAGGGSVDQQAARESLKRLETSPLWRRLRAVRNGRLYPVDSAYWFRGGVRAADLIVSNLFHYVAEKS